MKLKVLFLLTIVFMLSATTYAQRGVRIGYIDTEYILEKIPEYQEATTQLASKVQKWKGEIETQLSGIEQKRKDLSNEKALLTAELITEREEDITFEEKEILDYQQKRFGPNGDLMIQKKQLIQPIQDQIFAAVQDIAAKKKYDFVFDKSADVVMLYSAERFDMSELVIRTITRASKRKQAQSRSERKTAEAEEAVPEINVEQEARQQALDEKQAERESATDKRKQEIIDAREAKKQAAADRRAKILEDRAKARQDKLDERNNATEDATTEEEDVIDEEATDEEIMDEEDEGETEDKTLEEEEESKTPEELLEERKQKKLEDRAARKKALEERKNKILEERQKAKEERENTNSEAPNTDDDGGE